MKLFIPEFTYCFCGAPAVETITVEGQSHKRRIRQSNATKHWRPTLTAIAEEGVAREVRRQREPGAGFRSEKRPLIKSKLTGKTRSDSYGSDYRCFIIISSFDQVVISSLPLETEDKGSIFTLCNAGVTNVISLIKLRVAFHAINARRLPLAPLVYTLVRPSVISGRIVLSIEVKLNYLEQPIPPAPVAPEGQLVAPEITAAHTAWIKGSKEIVGLMLMTMEPEIQRNLENLHAHEMLQELKTLFAQQAEQELLQTTRDFHSCKQEEGQSVSSYVLKMKGYIDNLERLGHPVSLGLAVSLILISLRKEFDGFVQNYNMHSMRKTVNELHAMLKLHEQTLPKNNAPALHAIRAGKVQKGNKHKKPQPQLAARGQNQGKGKNKLAYAPKPKIPPPPKREDPAKDYVCHQCGDTGHWKRNCPQYLAELLKNKKLSQGASGSGFFTIELYTFPNKSWVYDTGCGTHICNTTQGLRASRKLKPGTLSLYVGNGQRAKVEAIRSYHLSLPSGLVIVLNNCHYAPSITRGIISVSRLYDDGYINHFVDNSIQVSKNNMVYFSAVPRDGIFEIDLSDSYTNVSSIYALSNKRSKSNLDSALLWHCHLGHISKKRIENLQHDGLLNSTDLRAFEKCVPCMSGKMARKPYTHQVERAKDLHGLIHTDVCGPFKIVSRQGASYFVTFIDDFGRYGYVYLLKHKYEVFETFKVFQKEVENQLGKTIKSLCSDCGGEYMSQEFLDHLKDHGIIVYRTPPYTPQHNGVSERRNIILLDMVRSMMGQTTLPKSFWDYALETVARILNMVPTKKVEKTPYEPDKLEPRSIKCIFIGYPKETMGYSFYYPPENKVLIAQNAEFLENSLIYQEASESLEDLEIIQEEDMQPSIDTSLNPEEDNLEIDEP
ncbi:zinc finger, CCHC-type containing protein [Tanacetum coccineum]